MSFIKVMYQTAHQQRVERFMRLAEQEIPYKPVVPSEEIRRLRAALILEEALETIEALGFSLFDCNIYIKPENLKLHPHNKGCDLEGVTDGCADLSVVTIGTLSAFGVADIPVLSEVDNANLRKFGPGGHKREDGKWTKPPDWRPPDIMGVLREQGYEPPISEDERRSYFKHNDDLEGCP